MISDFCDGAIKIGSSTLGVGPTELGWSVTARSRWPVIGAVSSRGNEIPSIGPIIGGGGGERIGLCWRGSASRTEICMLLCVVHDRYIPHVTYVAIEVQNYRQNSLQNYLEMIPLFPTCPLASWVTCVVWSSSSRRCHPDVDGLFDVLFVFASFLDKIPYTT